MGAAENSMLLIPGCEVLVNGKALSTPLDGQLIDVVVDDEVGLPGMFELEFSGVGSSDEEHDKTWFDDQPPFAPGDEVEVRLGYIGKLASAIIGDVIAIEAHFSADRVPGLTVRGYDRRHRLTRGRHSRTFVKRKDSEVAREIAQALSLAIEVKDSGLKLDYLVQHNQTDLEFLRERASRIDYALTITGKTLNFKPAGHAAAAAVKLAMSKDLIDFEPRLSLADQATALTLRGWDVAARKELAIEAKSSALPAMGGKDTGVALARRALKAAPAQVSNRPVATPDEGERLAAAALSQRTLQLITGEARLWGRTDITAGSVVSIAGAGKLYSGDYYVTAVKQHYEPHRSFHTVICVQRTAA